MTLLIAFVSGEGILVFSHHLPHQIILVAILIFVILLKYYCRSRQARKLLFNGIVKLNGCRVLKYGDVVYRAINKILILFIICLLGIGFASWRAQHILSWHLPAKYIDQTVTIIGQVQAVTKQDKHRLTMRVKLKKINRQAVNALIRLSWYENYPEIKPGDSWRWHVRLKPARGLHNFSGFNYDRWLFAHHIRATGYVVGKLSQQLLRREYQFGFATFRAEVQNIIQQNINHNNIAAIITSLTVGLRDGLNFKDWQILQRTGTSHLFAISGLHVGFVVAIIYWLASFLWRRFAYVLLLLPAQRFAAMTSMLAAVFYGTLVGWSLPTQRAVIMMITLFGAELLARRMPIWQRLLLAFVIVVTLHPFALFTASLWLSFLAVAALGFGLLLANKKPKWQQWLIIQMVITVGLLPITLFFFQKVSLVSVFANMIAIPVVTMLVVPLSLFALLMHFFSHLLGWYCYWITAKCVTGLWWYLSWLANLPQALWWHGINNIWILIAAMVGLVILFLPRSWPARWLGLIWCLPLFCFQPAAPKSGQVWLTLLDVGQGLSAVIRTAHHTLVYDAGPKSFTGFDAGQAVVIPYLLHDNINRVDTLMISHGDNDHIGGANAIIKNLTVKKILTSVPQRFHFKNTVACHAGQRWQWDGVKFKVLYPPVNQPYLGNNSSCVLRISIGDKHILLDGDIEKLAEQWLLKHHQNVTANIIVVPHHGSKTSSTLPFVRAVHPQLALFPLGYFNRFAFPSKKVVLRYQHVGAKIFTTAHDGAILIKVDSRMPLAINTVLQTTYFWRF
jgi:competence protein ComEC